MMLINSEYRTKYYFKYFFYLNIKTYCDWITNLNNRSINVLNFAKNFIGS